MLEFSCKLFRSDRKSTRLNSSHTLISYAVFYLKKNEHSKQNWNRVCPRNRRSNVSRPSTLHLGSVGASHPLPCFLQTFPALFALFVFFNARAPPVNPPFSLHHPPPA